MEGHSSDHPIKLLIIGDSGVGKTSLLLRYTDNIFTENLLTTGMSFKTKVINLNSNLYKLEIWHSEVNEKTFTLPKIYYKGTRGILITYDVTDKNSFNNVKNWIKQIENNAEKNVKKVLVGNKYDKPNRTVTEEEGRKLADECGMKFFEISAKTSQNVDEVFNYLAKEIFNS